jgi:membrane fusion protein (multidrug efflux system)
MALPKYVKIGGGAVLLACLIGSFLYVNRPESSSTLQGTDDAYVKADLTLLAPQVSGRIVDVHVEDNQFVQAGDVLATIDDRDFTLAVDSTKAQVQSAAAVIQGLQAHQALQSSLIQEAKATLVADDAAIKLAKADLLRYRNLAADGSGTVQALQQAEAKLLIQQATRDKDFSVSLAANQQLDILSADLQKAQAGLQQSKAALGLAELNLSYTRIVAPVTGTIGERTVRVGGFVTTGKPIITIVPLQSLYVEANYRETQLARVIPGQPVRIRVDALPGAVLQGQVQSLGPASGVSYSAIAPHNATGNFTKIVQRLPVRIALDAQQPDLDRLRVGMSVQPEIDVNGVMKSGLSKADTRPILLSRKEAATPYALNE